MFLCIFHINEFRTFLFDNFSEFGFEKLFLVAFPTIFYVKKLYWLLAQCDDLSLFWFYGFHGDLTIFVSVCFFFFQWNENRTPAQLYTSNSDQINIKSGIVSKQIWSKSCSVIIKEALKWSTTVSLPPEVPYVNRKCLLSLVAVYCHIIDGDIKNSWPHYFNAFAH